MQLVLDDLLADLRHARRGGDLGRLAFIAYCEVRRWARQAGEPALAEHASEMIIANPHASRESFLEQIDTLIDELQQARPRIPDPAAALPARGADHAAPGSTRPG